MSRLVDRGFDRLANVEGRYLAILFFSVLLLYTLALVNQALGYSEAARLFPLIVGFPLLAMLVVYILLLALQNRIDVRTVGFFDDVGNIGEEVSGTVEMDRSDRYRREFSMVLWVGSLILLTWLIGNLVAVAVFVFTFIYVNERAFVRALLVAAVTFGFIYLLFVQILGATLWRGVVPLGGMVP